MPLAGHTNAAAAKVRGVLAGLPSDLGALVRKHVVLALQDAPSDADLRLGCDPGARGYFMGHPLRGPDEEPELWSVRPDGQGDETIVPTPVPPGGVIKLFLGNIADLNELGEVLLHELAHFFGEDEDEVAEAGLGTFSREGGGGSPCR